MPDTCTFRTDLLRKTGLEMPKHTFYEDNYMVYGNLRFVERLYYMNCDLYLYAIGREGQSVQEDVMKKRYMHQIRSTELCFKAFHFDEITDRRKRTYLKHEMFIMFGIAIIFTRLNGTQQAEDDIARMWENCRAFDKKWADYFRYRTSLRLISVEGKPGADMVKLMYRIAHRIVRFN